MKKKIIDLISKSNTLEVIEILKGNLLDTDLNIDILMISSRHESLLKEIAHGGISRAEKIQEQNNINKSLIDLIYRLPDNFTYNDSTENKDNRNSNYVNKIGINDKNWLQLNELLISNKDETESTFPNTAFTKKSLNIVVIGKSGVGKSALVSHLFEQEISESKLGRPITMENLELSKFV